MIKTRLTRRALLGALLAFLPFPRRGGAQTGDRGIGGTGAVILPEDRGIGGTGVIGTIRGFGSIIVNEMRIAYSEYALLEIDGEPAPHVDLRVGQVVQVVARPTESGFETDRITVASEVVGPIAAVRKGALTVLGQTVSTENIGDRGWKTGQWIAVSGLRRLDGTIVASLAEIRAERPGVRRAARVAGPVSAAPGGGTRIGGLRIADLDPALAGRRVLVELSLAGGEAKARKTTVDPEFAAMPGVTRASIEAFVATAGAQTHFGSGLTAASPPVAGDFHRVARLRRRRRQAERRVDGGRAAKRAAARPGAAGSQAAGFAAVGKPRGSLPSRRRPPAHAPWRAFAIKARDRFPRRSQAVAASRSAFLRTSGGTKALAWPPFFVPSFILAVKTIRFQAISGNMRRRGALTRRKAILRT